MNTTWMLIIANVGIFVGTIALFIFTLNYLVEKKKKKEEKVDEAYERRLFDIKPNGLVVVNQGYLDYHRKPLFTTLALCEPRMPWPASDMIAWHDPSGIYNMTTWMNVDMKNLDQPEAARILDHARCMTIGSAVFKYAIPESFVVADYECIQIYHRYMNDHSERAHYDKWFQENQQSIKEISDTNTAYQSQRLGFTVAKVATFYNRHYVKIADALIVASEKPNMPTLGGFIRFMLAQLGLDQQSELNINLMYMVINVVIRNSNIEVPSSWITPSEFANDLHERVLAAALGEAGKKDKQTKKKEEGVKSANHLRLVINNQQQEGKK